MSGIGSAAAILMGLAWVWYFARWDRHPEPPQRLLATFVAGGLIVLPVVWLESPARGWAAMGGRWLMVAAFLWVAPVEEVGKGVAAYAVALRTPDANERTDFFVYLATAALGFAAVENVIYLKAWGAPTLPLRGVVTSLAHVSFSSWLARQWVEGRAGIGLLQAVFAHGLYDTLLFHGGPFLPGALAVVAGGLGLLFRSVRQQAFTIR